MPSREQIRAQLVFAKVSAIAGSNEDNDFKKKYGSNCRRLASLIHQCGLCQTVAFMQSKAAREPAFHKLLSDFASVLLPEGQHPHANTLATQTRTIPFSSYQWLSRDALQCATWFKRYAEALLPREDS
ncbi:MAG: type III-B CRISPR module-associated protein Cmr5 [Bryobacterales bacterium]|nr:type III-B CRISPR module-associated protein Cmr5 [Bryobacterales bacterium]